MLDYAQTRRWLAAFDFRALFIQGLGWDRHSAQREVTVDGAAFRLTAIAQKRGAQIFRCSPNTDGRLPEYDVRRKIHAALAKTDFEHLIIFADAAETAQVWQWVSKRPGRPAAYREYRYHKGYADESLLQKLGGIHFRLSEEEELSITGVTERLKDAFDKEPVTRRFYDRFKRERDAFHAFLEGIPDEGLQRWYVSVTLNRLMFIYFLQKKGFLNGDQDYLRTKLAQVMATGPDRYYRHFLCPLFFEGFAKRGDQRSPDTSRLLGQVPYLNGGLFQKHEIEERFGETIHIPDAAFESLFRFFEDYRWHLDERPMKEANEVNPDVLGYIFEKYINQREMGAYYTKEDITGYISRNTIIPFLLNATRQGCPVAFEGDGSVWKLLQSDPDRYLYPAVRQGTELPLPADIAAGVADVSKRVGWNRPAPAPYANPTEIWREVVARRQRYEEVRAKLAAGEVRSVDDLITYNLDVEQFAQDVIENADESELKALWRALHKLTVLDPTVGSGAFLFAALNLLERLYEACLDRMEALVGDLERSGEKPRSNRMEPFKKALDETSQHSNPRYSILKNIVVNNLYGVDIMEEAVEICRLRLFLKLVAQLEPGDPIEPLPDIDFNVRAGNTLVGYVTRDEVRRAAAQVAVGQGNVQYKMLSDHEQDALARIEEAAGDVDSLFRRFREQQTEYGGDVTPEDKAVLRQGLEVLAAELNGYLAREYGVDPGNRPAYARWLTTHRPFHWFVEFYGIMKAGGFDVIVGNPPYVVYSPAKVEYRLEPLGYHTLATKNLYAYVFERAVRLASQHALIGLIVQLTALSSEKLPTLQDLLLRRGTMLALPFPRRPESMFDGVEMPVAVILSDPRTSSGLVTSRVGRMYAEERSTALSAIRLTHHNVRVDGYRIGKFGCEVEAYIYQRILGSKPTILASLVLAGCQPVLYYQEACRYWVRACRGLPFFTRNGVRMPPAHGRILYLSDDQALSLAVCALNSSLFYWFYSVFSDCEHINDGLIRGFPIPTNWRQTDWAVLADALSADLLHNASRKVITTKEGHVIEYDEMKAMFSKPLIDEIDRALAKHYGFPAEELDFVINYDIKYRMGISGDRDAE